MPEEKATTTLRERYASPRGERPHRNPVALPLAAEPRPAAPRPWRLLGADETLDRVTRLAARLLDAPAAFVALTEPYPRFTEGGVHPRGAPEPTPAHPCCQHVVATGAPVAVADTRTDPHLKDDPVLRDHGIAAYLGVPLRAPTGEVLGALCVVGHEPRTWSADDEAALAELAAVATDEVELRAAVGRLEG